MNKSRDRRGLPLPIAFLLVVGFMAYLNHPTGEVGKTIDQHINETDIYFTHRRFKTQVSKTSTYVRSKVSAELERSYKVLNGKEINPEKLFKTKHEKQEKFNSLRNIASDKRKPNSLKYLLAIESKL